MKTVVIVDDSQFMRKSLKDILQNAGYNVVGEAANGESAIDMYNRLKPDLMTMDITMPGLSGLEALKEINKTNTHTKIVMCSSMSSKDHIKDSIEHGAVDFIIKPFQPINVIEIINKVLNRCF